MTIFQWAQTQYALNYGQLLKLLLLHYLYYRPNDPVYNIIDHSTNEPVYSVPSNIDRSHDSHMTTDTEYHLVTEGKSHMTRDGYPDGVLSEKSRESQVYLKMDAQEKGAPCVEDDASHFYY